jgi:RND family efflux transporter MFP subunit
MRTKIFSVYMMTLLAMVTMFSSCAGKTGKSEEAVDMKVRVKTEEVTMGNVEQHITLSGNVEPFEKAFISSSNPVRIEKIYKRVGDFVRKGDLLVQMDGSNYRQAKVQYDNLALDYARFDTLLKVGSISQQQLDQMAMQLDVARTAYNSLVDNTQLRSPINGIVSGRFYEDGEMFGMSPLADGRVAILTVEVLDPVKVLVSVAEQYFPQIDKSMDVSLALDVYQGKVFEGSVYIKHPTIDPATRTFTLELQFPNSNYLIRPGMFGRVTLGFGRVERVLVSDLAVIRQQGTNERFVFVENNGKVERRVLTLGRLIGNRYEVINGLSNGESVVVAGHTRLLDGSEVEVISDVN